MHCYKKINALMRMLIVLCLLLGGANAFAKESSMLIKNAELNLTEQAYLLNADIEINFDAGIEEAVNKGVPLNFLLEFQVVTPKKYWFDDEIVTTSTTVTLSYHALSRQYLVNHGKHQMSYETLSEAKLALGQVREWNVFEAVLLEKAGVYNAALLMRLDQSKLPKVLQVDAISSINWNLSSQKFEWPLKELAK